MENKESNSAQLHLQVLKESVSILCLISLHQLEKVLMKSYLKVSASSHFKCAVTPLRSLQKYLNSFSHTFFWQLPILLQMFICYS